MAVAGEIQEFLASEAGNGQLKEERQALGKALAEVQNILGVLTGWLGEAQGGDTRALYKVGLSSRRFLLALGDLVVGWLLQRQAEVALKALAGEVSASRQGVLHRQGGRGPVLRPRGAAPHRRRPADHRGRRPRHHGPPGGGLLSRPRHA